MTGCLYVHRIKQGERERERERKSVGAGQRPGEGVRPFQRRHKKKYMRKPPPQILAPKSQIVQNLQGNETCGVFCLFGEGGPKTLNRVANSNPQSPSEAKSSMTGTVLSQCKHQKGGSHPKP